MNDIDKWAAETCGVEIYTAIDDYDNEKPESCWINGRVVKWTIEDPRCREIVREHFKIKTEYTGTDQDEWYSYSVIFGTTTIDKLWKTIAEAEIAAISAIYEASQ